MSCKRLKSVEPCKSTEVNEGQPELKDRWSKGAGCRERKK